MKLLAQRLGLRLAVELVLGPLQLTQVAPGQATLESFPARESPPLREEALPRELPSQVLGRPTGDQLPYMTGTTCTIEGLAQGV